MKAMEVAAGLAESNGSLQLGGWLKVICRPAACAPGSALGPTLGNEYRRTLPIYVCMYVCMFHLQWYSR